MNGYGFEGDIILEKLAEIGKVEEFYEAVDSDNFSKIEEPLKLVNASSETIQVVFEEMGNGL